MGYMKRSLEKVIMEACHEYQAIIVTGPRQVGKTTMLQKLMEGTNRTYVTLDDLNERALAQSDPEMFFQMHKPPILSMRYNTRRSCFPISSSMLTVISDTVISG